MLRKEGMWPALPLRQHHRQPSLSRFTPPLANNSLTLVPSFTGFAVTALLEEHFPDLVDTRSRHGMETSLDEISLARSNGPLPEQLFKGDQGP